MNRLYPASRLPAFLFAVLLLLLAACESGTLGSNDAGSDAGSDARDSGDDCQGGCPAGAVCVHGVCLTPCDQVECPPGTHCEAGTCVADDPCADVVCPNPGEVCQGGACVAGELDSDDDGYLARDDCDDADATVHPGADETCNGINDDCDATTPDGAFDCLGLCCGEPPACHTGCCSVAQCGAGDFECHDHSCVCPGAICGGVCDATVDSCCRAPVVAAWSFRSPSGTICNAQRTRVEDGEVAGLSCSAAGLVEVDGENVTACVEVDFGEPIESGTIRVVARASGGPVCENSCSSALCGTGQRTRAFAGIGGSDYRTIGVMVLTRSLGEHVFAPTFPFSHALVCRTGYGCERDHVEVDYVEACAEP